MPSTSYLFASDKVMRIFLKKNFYVKLQNMPHLCRAEPNLLHSCLPTKEWPPERVLQREFINDGLNKTRMSEIDAKI